MTLDILKSTEKEMGYVSNQIVEFNRVALPFTQDEDYVKLNFNIKNETGDIIAGINAVMYAWHILYVTILFVNEAYRGQKLGSMLLNHVETQARDKGATMVHLDTFDFQAKDFYLKHGYEIYGVLEDYPEGHARYYLKKKL